MSAGEICLNCLAYVLYFMAHAYVIYTQSVMAAGLGRIEALSSLEAAQADM